MGSLFGAKPIRPVAFGGVRELEEALAGFRKGESGQLEALLSHPRANHRYFFAFEAAEVVERPLVEAWANQYPDHLPALLLKAANGLTWAWQARGNQAASRTSAEQFLGFEDRLKVVAHDLQELERRLPQDPNPLALQIILAKAQNWPGPARRQLFERAVALEPDHYPAHRNYLDGLLMKWGGDHRQAADFALQAARGAAQGSDLGCLVFVAYLEQWLYHQAFERQPALAAEFCQRHDVVATTREVYSRWAASPDWPGAPEARNHAAMWLFLCGQKDLLRQELKALGPRLRESPWDYLGQPAEVFARARKYAGA